MSREPGTGPVLRVVGADFEAPETLIEEAVETAEDASLHWSDLVEGRGPRDRALELLVDMVRGGTVDPWDVDLRLVVDRYLEAIEAMGPGDLPKSGRLLFFASVLVRMKAQLLAGQGASLVAEPLAEDAGDMGSEDWLPEEIDDDEASAALFRSPRRGAGEIVLFPRERSVKSRPLTVRDLLDALERAEAHERKMEAERARKNRKNVVPFKNVREAMATVHQDDFETDVRTAKALLDQALALAGEADLRIFEGSLDRISGYLSLLFLAAKGEVELRQPEFYGEVRIVRGDPAGLAAGAEPRDRYLPVKRPRKAKAAEVPGTDPGAPHDTPPATVPDATDEETP